MALDPYLIPNKHTFDGQVFPGPPIYTPQAGRSYGCLDDTLKYQFGPDMSRNEINRCIERDKWKDQDIGLPQYIMTKDTVIGQEAKYHLLREEQRLQVAGGRLPLIYHVVSLLLG